MKKLLSLLILAFFAVSAFAKGGDLLSKTKFEVSATPFWERISENGMLKSEFKHVEKLDFFEITYESDGLTVKGFAVEPKAKGKFPVVVYNRGGNRDFGKVNAAQLIIVTAKLASEGFVILASNYRGTDGTKGQDEFGGAEVDDVLTLAKTAKFIKKANAKKIGLFGWSRGSMMTYLALKGSNSFKTAVVVNGMTDLFEWAKERDGIEKEVYEECIPNYKIERERALKERSAIFWADRLSKKSSLLIITGSQDELVNPEHSRRMAKELKKIKYDFEFKEFQTDHQFNGKDDEINRELIDWFSRKLK